MDEPISSGLAQLVFLILIRWIVIYKMNSAIHLLNNRANYKESRNYQQKMLKRVLNFKSFKVLRISKC